MSKNHRTWDHNKIYFYSHLLSNVCLFWPSSTYNQITLSTLIFTHHSLFKLNIKPRDSFHFKSKYPNYYFSFKSQVSYNNTRTNMAAHNYYDQEICFQKLKTAIWDEPEPPIFISCQPYSTINYI